MELRVDVHHEPSGLEKELDSLYQRLNRPGDALHGLAPIDINFPGLAFRYREADGEHYVYAEDLSRRRLAGYTIFNRLVEVDRQADRVLRAPHSKYAPAYQRRGIATAIYQWWLKGERCLITGARQSVGANALWHSLRKSYESLYVDLRDKTLRYLGHQVSTQVQEELHTRMILLGDGWCTDRLAKHAGMLVSCETANDSCRTGLLLNR